MKSKEKLLLMGISTDTRYAIDYAKKTGVTTIVTDYFPPEIKPEKRMADEYWMIDLNDLDTLEKRCREEQVTAVYAGNNEFCLEKTRELAKRLGLPFYASDEGWACMKDKSRFKEHCIACGLDVPRQYALSWPPERKELEKIGYPVVIKPVDGSCRLGMSICHDEKELLAGYEKALLASARGKILVEDYIEGQEMDVDFFLEDGEPVVTHVTEYLTMDVNGMRQFSLVVYPGLAYDSFLQEMYGKVKALFKHMDCRKGAAFLQIIRKEGKYYFLEMNYRFEGGAIWTTAKRLTGYSCVEAMVDLALGRHFSIKKEGIDLDPEGKFSAQYLVWTRGEGKVERIEGLDDVKAMEDVEVVLERFRVGDEVKRTDSMLQIAYYIGITARSKEELIRKIVHINDKLAIYGENGENLLVPFEDYDTVYASFGR